MVLEMSTSTSLYSSLVIKCGSSPDSVTTFANDELTVASSVPITQLQPTDYGISLVLVQQLS